MQGQIGSRPGLAFTSTPGYDVVAFLALHRFDGTPQPLPLHFAS